MIRKGDWFKDPRWRSPVDCGLWEELKIVPPNTEEIEKAHQAARADLDNMDLFEKEMELWMAPVLTWDGTKTANELLVIDYEGYSLPNLVAMKLGTSLPYDHNCLWALAAIHPEYHSSWCFRELPLVPTEEDQSEHARWWKLAQKGVEVPHPKIVERYQRWLDRGHNYSTFRMLQDGYLNQAMWFFREVLGMKLEYKDLHLGILWTWG
jgi:hypothetical protein